MPLDIVLVLPYDVKKTASCGGLGYMEILTANTPRTPVTTVLFDWDGTISTLRHGWEGIMEPMMIELLGDDSAEAVRAYIDESTGIQTIHQMKWLAEQTRLRTGTAADPWTYKAEYNRRLMEPVSLRLSALRSGAARREDYLIAGGEALLRSLCERGVALYVASGTDDPDVRAEVEVLGLTKYFTKIAGAPLGVENCSKERVIRELLSAGIPGGELAVVGDGKVEIAVGRENGARTLGVASDEDALRGVNEVKRARLVKVGADVIVGDFLELDAILRFFMGE